MNAEKRGEPGPGPETQDVAAPEPVHSADSPPAGGAGPGAPDGSNSGHSALLERLLVSDSASSVDSPQMRKGDFLLALQAEVTNAAEEELARGNRAIGNCPWIEYWFAYYRRRDPAHVARAVVKYAPEAASAGSLSGAIAAVARRARESVRISLAAGRPIGAPAGIPESVFDPRSAQRVPSGEPPVDPVLNAPPDAPRELSNGDPLGLGDGRPLETTTRTRMEAAFGTDLTGVRVHTDARGQTAAGHERARAFAYGTDIAFAPGQHRPGTLVGDALLAHELAHVLQQGTGRQRSSIPTEMSAHELEADADRAALGVMPRLWTGAGPFGMARADQPRVRTAPVLSRCDGKRKAGVPEPPLSVDVRPVLLEGSNRDVGTDMSFGNTRVFPQANLTLNARPEEKVSEADTEALIGADTSVADASGETPSSEMVNVFRKYVSATVATIVYVSEIAPRDKCATDDTAGVTHQWGSGPGVIMVENDAIPQATSHELGHLMDLEHVSDTRNLMYESEGNDRVHLTSDQITEIRDSRFAT